ncbi:MAG: efflux transporter outer membrane subunit [Betaproteobacteria bacterium]|nr:efflux transporter outer membrane subunit [Betaproteobacteria bacterium]
MRHCYLAAVLVMAGCTAQHSAYQRPVSLPPTEFLGAEGGPATTPAFGDFGWWEIYDDPQLTGLIRLALARNHDIKIAVARIAEARATLGVAQFGPLPQANVNAGATRSRVSEVGSMPLPPNTGSNRRNFRITGDASYEIDFWGRLAALTEASRQDVLVAELTRDVVTATLVGDVATAWFDLVSLDQQLVITEQSVETRRRFLGLTQSRFRLGAATRVDVDRAQANLTAARIVIPDLRRRIAQTENLLQLLAGGYPASVDRPRATVDSMPAAPDVPVGLPSALLERRPDIRAAEHTIIGANARLAAQRAALLPSFSLTGQFGSESGLLKNFLTAPSLIWSLGGSIVQPLINAQRNHLLVDGAAAREVQNIEQYQKVVEQSVREVSDALVGRQEFGEVRKAKLEQVESLREVNRVSLRRYEAGVASYFEVIDAQRELLAAELNLAQAQRNVLVSSVQLHKALGGGWQVEGGKR